MLKKLGASEYSLKVTFWLFGLLGFSIFYLLTSITHSGVLRNICPYGRLCDKNIVLYTLSNFANLMLGRLNNTTQIYLIIHILLSAVFVAYMIVVLRGLLKSCASFSGSRFWVYAAKFFLICLMLYCFKSII